MKFEKLKTKSLNNFKEDALSSLKNVKGGDCVKTYYSGQLKDDYDDDTFGQKGDWYDYETNTTY